MVQTLCAGTPTSTTNFERNTNVELSAPTKIIFLISLILAILGALPLLGIAVPFVGLQAAWSLLAAYVLLALGVLLKGL